MIHEKRKRVRSSLEKAQVGSGSRAPALDHIDRRVIASLQSDGRRSFASIAGELDIGESVVRYRVQRLENAGILQIVGIADPLKIGFDLMAMVGVRVRPGGLHPARTADRPDIGRRRVAGHARARAGGARRDAGGPAGATRTVAGRDVKG